MYTIKEIAAEMQVSRQRIHQLVHGYTTVINGRKYQYPPLVDYYTDYVWNLGEMVILPEGYGKIKNYFNK
jgi:hypothetical protein